MYPRELHIYFCHSPPKRAITYKRYPEKYAFILHVADSETCILRKLTGDIMYDNKTMIATVQFMGGSEVTTECQVDKHPYISCKSMLVLSGMHGQYVYVYVTVCICGMMHVGVNV